MTILAKSFYTLLGLLTASDLIEYRMNKEDTEITPPPDTVSIVIPALNEEVFVEACLKSLRNQSIVKAYPQYFEFVFVDNGSIDNTPIIAKPYVDKLLFSERGKLTARNVGTDNSNGNIIVSVDSDCSYSEHCLNTLLKSFNDPRIAGVAGSVIDISSVLPSQLYVITMALDSYIIAPYRMRGCCNACYKYLFNKVGKFDESINQLDRREVIKEEEINLGDKLSEYGYVIQKVNALCYHLGGSRTDCRIGLRSSQECAQHKIRVERFGNVQYIK